MKKWAALSVFYFLLSTAALAQFTQVSGTITDPNGVPYALGTITAHLVVSATPTMSGGSFDASDKTAGLDRNGSFAFQLADNTQISPGSSTYTFTVCSGVGTVQPAGGKGSVCFTVAGVTISGTSQDISANLRPTPALTASASAVGSINAGSYPIFRDTKFISDPTLSIGSNVITCAQNDCNFTAADNGKVCFATNMTTDTSQMNSVVILPQGTLTVTGAQTATCSGGNSTANVTNSGVFVWGHLDSAAFNATQNASTDPLFAAWTDAQSQCKPLVLPAGIYLVERGEFITYTSGLPCALGPINGNAALAIRRGYQVSGAGKTETILIPTPNFPYTDCTGPNGTGAGCLFSVPNITISDLGVWGVGQSFPVGFNLVAIIDVTGYSPGTNAFMHSVNLYGWSANKGGPNAGFGVRVESSANGLWVDGSSMIEAFGYNGLSLSMSAGSQVFWYGGVICCSQGSEIGILSGQLFTYGVYHGSSGGSGTTDAQTVSGANSKWFATGDFWSLPGIAANHYGTNVSSSGTFHCTGCQINVPSTANAYNVAATAGGSVYLADSLVTGNPVARAVALQGGSAFYDQGGNTISGFTDQGGGTNNWYGSTSVTGAPQTSGNWSVPAGAGAGQWGTSPSVGTCTGSARTQQCTITVGSGTVGANPILTATFPGSLNTPWAVAPICSARMTGFGGGGAFANFVTGSVSTANAVFTYQGTPAASSTMVVQIRCDLP